MININDPWAWQGSDIARHGDSGTFETCFCQRASSTSRRYVAQYTAERYGPQQATASASTDQDAVPDPSCGAVEGRTAGRGSGFGFTSISPQRPSIPPDCSPPRYPVLSLVTLAAVRSSGCAPDLLAWRLRRKDGTLGKTLTTELVLTLTYGLGWLPIYAVIYATFWRD
jgi:hypothetical protein